MSWSAKWKGLCACVAVVAASAGRAPAAAPPAGTPAEAIQTLPGFKVELVLTADKVKNGSWINMCKDPQGRLLLGGQRGQPVTRVTLDADGKVAKEEILKLPVTETMGMLFIGDALYLDGYGKKPDGHGAFGLFRLRDPNGNGTFESVEFLREWENGSGEHGAHAILLGPDHKHLYIVCGNFVEQPKDLSPASPHRHFADDLVLPRAEDGNGFGAGKVPPGGSIFRMDLDGKDCELYASGQRNTYDIAFNADGELLGFDSDMEWDWGMPWYRPIRIFHAPSGFDGGFREGTAKWPEYYPDSLSPVVNVGIGCPTGVVFGYGAKFPAKYQKAFYVLDWTYGRLIAVHMKPRGASYEGTWENFLAPKTLHSEGRKDPLNLTDVVIGNDGALYFTVGGRSTQANLYRVSYTGDESTAAVDPHDSDGSDARAHRRKLEAFQGHPNPAAIETAWPDLGSSDRFIRYAARLAIESQPVEEWKARALAEPRPQAALTALLALARLGPTDVQADVLKSLARFPLASLDEPQRLDKLRVIEVSISRHGKPGPEVTKQIVDELDPQYPAKSYAMNRELCQVLLALNAPGAVTKTMQLLDAASTQEEQIGYVLYLRTIKDGWTPELRRQYFSWWIPGRANKAQWPWVTQWFKDAGREYDDGASFPKFIAHFHDDAARTLTPDEAKALEPVLAAFPSQNAQPRRPARVHKFVREWTMADLEPSLGGVSHGRNFRRGRETFADAQCASCHRFGNEGGSTGPELTAVASRFSRHDILESILLPSKVISEQFQNTQFQTKSGNVIVGRVLEENADHLIVQPDPLKPDKIEVKKSDIARRAASKVSPMPEGLVNTFTKDEILDLVAYLESAGKRDHPDFKK
jgi:putative heme-binding domain-containing protein